MRRTSTTVAAIAAGGLLAGTLATPTTSTAAEPRDVGKDVAYSCVVVQNGVDHGPFGVAERITVPLPRSVAPGQRLDQRNVKAVWKMSQEMHQYWVGGYAYEGTSSDTALTIGAGGSDTTVGVRDFEAPHQEMSPHPVDEWNVAGKGTLGAITVPRSARPGGKLTLTMPGHFVVDAVAYDELETAFPHELDCSVTGDPAMGSVRIAKAKPHVRASVRPKPIIAHRTRARVAVRVNTPAGVRATGKVTVKRGGNTLGRARVRHSGRAIVRLHRIAKPGRARLRIRYTGNRAVAHKSVGRTVHIVSR